MIQMKNGVYGARHFMKRASDGPFSLSEAEEARLVDRGVAEYVDGAEPPADGEPIGFNDTPPVPEETGNNSEQSKTDDATELPELPDGVVGIQEYSVKMKAAELREIGKLCGLTFKVGMTKEEMVAALDKHIEENTVEDDEEDAPSFNAADAVQ